MTDQPDFTSPLAGRIEVRDPCPWCPGRTMVARSQMDEHVARLHPEVRTVDVSADRAALRNRIAETLDSLQGTAHHLPFATRERVIEVVTGAVLPQPADRAALRDRIAAAIWAQYSDAEPSRTGLVMANPHAVADAVLAVLPPPANQTAVLREEPETPLEKRLRYSERRNDELRAECKRRGKIKLEQAETIARLERQLDEVRTQLGAEILRAGQAEAELRRMADEAAVVPPPALTEEGRLRAKVELLTENAERSEGLTQLGARCFRDHHDAQLAEARAITEGHRFALSNTLGLGTGATWEAIHERVADTLRRMADEEQTGTEARHVGGRVNAEDCPACCASPTPPPYPWICPGEPPAAPSV